ncbi:hypothetical protein GP486_006150, partial [Trichoglossum hirsutum]
IHGLVAHVVIGVSLGWSPDEIVPIGETRTTIIDLPGGRPGRINQVEMSIRCTGTLNIAALVNFIKGGQIPLDPMGDTVLESLLKWLGALFRKDPMSRFVTRPNSNAYFERSRETSIPLHSTNGVLEAWRGMYQTVQIRFGRITVNVDTATTAFWTPDKNLIDLCQALAGVPSGLEGWFEQNASRFFHECSRLVGIFFQVRHLNPDRNARKVRFIKWSSKNALQTEFNITTGSSQVVKTNVNEHGERFKEPLQGAETADFIKFATSPATVRAQQITECVKKLHWHELMLPREFGISVKPNMLQVDGRILPSPIPQYGGGTDKYPFESGRWNLRGKRFIEAKSIKSWGLMYFPAGRPVDDRSLQQFAKLISSAFNGLGINTPRDLPAFLLGNPHGDIRTMIAELISKSHSTHGSRPDLLIFIQHGSNEGIYRAVKNICDIQHGVASQVMLVEKSVQGRGQQQYLANIGLKVNAKLGGINSFIREPLFEKGRWMMIGGDTSHPSPAQMRMNPPPPAFAAVCGSYDKYCMRYTAVATAQGGKELLISGFEDISRELFKRFKEKNNGHMPDSIIYYRDGLSEGEFSQIMASEAEPLRGKFHIAELSTGKTPRITVVACVKRHHTRLFPTEQGDKLGNVLPGTVVENSALNDIFLVAHPGLQGTVRPTRYVVLADQNNLSADEFQRVTNNLCYSYARATTAVSIVYYADQACERARLHVRHNEDDSQILGEVHRNLKYSMYWQ